VDPPNLAHDRSSEELTSRQNKACEKLGIDSTMALGREEGDHLVKASCSMEFLVWPPYGLALSVTTAMLAVSAVSTFDVVIASFLSFSFSSGVGAGSGDLSVRLHRLSHAVYRLFGDGCRSSGAGGSFDRGSSF
jgi:hypothetical protein